MQVSDVNFKLQVNERGTRFREQIRINEKENTVSFKVPKQNNIDRSEVLNDFNLVNLNNFSLQLGLYI